VRELVSVATPETQDTWLKRNPEHLAQGSQETRKELILEVKKAGSAAVGSGRAAVKIGGWCAE
jgi:hypothetical protein